MWARSENYYWFMCVRRKFTVSPVRINGNWNWIVTNLNLNQHSHKCEINIQNACKEMDGKTEEELEPTLILFLIK